MINRFEIVELVVTVAITNCLAVLALISGAIETRFSNGRKANWVLIVLLIGTIIALFAASAQAQVLTTADTLGQGKQAVMVSENHLDDAGLGINMAYAMYVRGLTSKFDLYVTIGQTRLLGEEQIWVSVGGNRQVLHVNKTSVSLFTTVATPIMRTREASILLLNPAVVISQALGPKISVYSGINTLVPIGQVSRGFFTPTDNRFNVPVGAVLTFGNWGLCTEADLGHLKALGIGLSRVF